MRQLVQRFPVAVFVGLTFLISWTAWLPLLARARGWLSGPPHSQLHLLGSLGPALAALVVVACVEGRSGPVGLGRRLVAWRHRSAAWAFVLLVPPVLLLVAGPAAALLSGEGLNHLDWAAFGRSTEFTGLSLVGYWSVNLVFFGVGEELGWRGFLQPHLEARRPPVLAAGLVSLPWALWHLPLFGITPSYRAMPLIGFVGFALNIWVASWIFAWLLHVGLRGRAAAGQLQEAVQHDQPDEGHGCTHGRRQSGGTATPAGPTLLRSSPRGRADCAVRGQPRARRSSSGEAPGHRPREGCSAVPCEVRPVRDHPAQ